MNFSNSLTTSLTSLITLLLFLPSLTSSQTCQKTCGNIPIKYPFGTGPGCGDPRFQPYVTCNHDQQQLTLTTHTGCYAVSSIDYTSQVIYISDPTMSTCSCTQPSKGFGLDWNAPFAFRENTIFVLLDCSSTSFLEGGGSNSTMCDAEGGASICSLLYSCGAVSRLGLPISTCCVYAPVDLGPSFEMDLRKLGCASYSALYGFDGRDLTDWKYGIALKYKFNFDNDYPALCGGCEKSNGVCGFDSDKSFNCNCPGGLNTTTDCFYGESWSYGSRFLPLEIGALAVLSFTWFILLAFM